jgi:hypothetical protein
MDKKDVKKGIKVIPHSKTHPRYESWKSWRDNEDSSTNKFFGENGFLYVSTIDGDEFWLNTSSDKRLGECFRASDFTPATIEVGDTVQTGDEYNDECAIVVGRMTGRDGSFLVEFPPSSRFGTHDGDGFNLAWGSHPTSGKCRWINEKNLTLIRKARKPEQPEQKKEDKPVSKKPRLEDINENYVLKLRNGNMAVAMKSGHPGDSDPVGVYERRHLTANGQRYSGKPSFEAVYGCLDEYVIVATKKMPKPSMAISAIITNTEPAWDWTIDMDKPAFKVGDWVEVVSSPNGWNVMAGEKGTVCETDDTDMPYRVCGIHGRKAWFRANQLKPCASPAPVEITAADIKAKFGDRVVVKLDGQSIEVK